MRDRYFSREQILNYATVLSGGLLLSVFALVNRYPLVYPDTGTYVAACFDHFIPRDRPLTYAFFLRHFSLATTLWIPMLAQCILVSWLILLSLRHFTAVKKIRAWHMIILLVLTFTTALGTVSSMMIPDIFTPVLVLTGGLVLFAENLTRSTRIFLLCVFTFAVTTHLSHYPMICALLGSAFIVWFLRRKKQNTFLQWKRLAQLSAMIPAAIVLTLLLNYITAQEWKFSPGGGHVFLMNRLWTSGVLDEYLDENCGKHTYTLCTHRPVEGVDFLWSDQSPVNAVYGWENWEKAKPEYDSIIDDALTTPKYLARYVRTNIRDAGAQLITFDVMLYRPLTEGQSVDAAIRQHLTGDMDNYRNSLQSVTGISFSWLNALQWIVCVMTILFLIALLFSGEMQRTMPAINPLLWWITGAMMFNALTVVSVAMVDARYQARLIWLLPLLALLFIANYVSKKSAKK